MQECPGFTGRLHAIYWLPAFLNRIGSVCVHVLSIGWCEVQLFGDLSQPQTGSPLLAHRDLVGAVGTSPGLTPPRILYDFGSALVDYLPQISLRRSGTSSLPQNDGFILQMSRACCLLMKANYDPVLLMG